MGRDRVGLVGRSRQELKHSPPTATKPSAMLGAFLCGNLFLPYGNFSLPYRPRSTFILFLKNRRSERPVQAFYSAGWTITTLSIFFTPLINSYIYTQN